MIYSDFLKGYSVLKDHGCDMTGAEGWEDWLACRNNSDGICRKHGTAKFYRFTTSIERRGRLDWRIYKVGNVIATEPPCEKKKITQYHCIIKRKELKK